MTEMFQEWYDNRHEYARDWKKRTGGKVVGFILGNASGWEYGVPNTGGLDRCHGISVRGYAEFGAEDLSWEEGRRGR